MMPVPSRPDSKRICVDANTVIDYIREHTLHELELPSTGKRAEALRVRLSEMRHVLVAKTAASEARKNLGKDIARKLGRLNAQDVTMAAEVNLRDYCATTQWPDSLDHVPAARAMYASISKDPASQKFSKWKKKKGMFVTCPVLGSDKNDLIILSTAADVAQEYEVELWTHDMDFTMFADEILRAFGVKIVDSYRLGG